MQGGEEVKPYYEDDFVALWHGPPSGLHVTCEQVEAALNRKATR